MYSTSPPAWKQLISPTLAIHKRIPLIESMVSDRDEAETVGHLHGVDAQAFIDMIYEVSIHVVHLQRMSWSVLNSNSCTLSVRHWIVSNRISVGNVCVFYTVFVAAKRSFQDHLQSHFVMTQRGTRCVMVGSQTCGRVGTKAGM